MPAPLIQSTLAMVNLVKESKLDWCILRGGVFYGPGTGTEEGWRKAAGTGSLRLPGDGSGFISHVLVFDMARPVVLAAEQVAPRYALAPRFRGRSIQMSQSPAFSHYSPHSATQVTPALSAESIR